MGGTQDNGTPYFTWDGSTASATFDLSRADGAYAYFRENYAYVSSQNGWVMRVGYDPSDNPTWEYGWTYVNPSGASGQMFINPYLVDQNNEEIMYYPAGQYMWRNNQLSSIPNYQYGTTLGWTRLDALTVPSGYLISCMAVSSTPAHVLYYGASNYNDLPLIYRLDNANTSVSSASAIPIPDAPSGVFVHSIAVNPADGDEIMVAFSNYNVVGLYRSTNGGHSYVAVEGNLEGDPQTPGPSLRSVAILPHNNGPSYFVSTSTGLYSTASLDGSNTVWVQESADGIGNNVTDYVVARTADSMIAAGTHGRGIFIGKAEPPSSCCIGIRGNVDGDVGDNIDISDLVYLVDYMFTGGPVPPCFDEANIDGAGDLDIADLVYLVDYMFNSGPPPVACP